MSSLHLLSRLRPGGRGDRAPAVEPTTVGPSSNRRARCRSVRLAAGGPTRFGAAVMARPRPAPRDGKQRDTSATTNIRLGMPIIVRAATELDAAAIGEAHAESWRIAYQPLFSPEFLAKAVEDRRAMWPTV